MTCATPPSPPETGSYYIYGSAGEDHIIGSDDSDTITGGDGADIIQGGPGKDNIDFGNDSAADTFEIGGFHFGGSNDRTLGNAEEYTNFGGNGDVVDLVSGMNLSSEDGNTTLSGSSSDDIASTDIATLDLDGSQVDFKANQKTIFHDTAEDEADFASDTNVSNYAQDLDDELVTSGGSSLDVLLFVEDSSANDVALFRVLDSGGNNSTLEDTNVHLLGVFEDAG